MKAWKFLAILLAILTTSGCSASKELVRKDSSKVMDVYLQGVSGGRADAVNFIRQNLKVSQAFGYVRPYAPVVEPADVRMVWFPAHKSKYSPEVLVSGHWVYIMVKEPGWFIDAQKEDRARIPLLIPYKETAKND